MRLRSLSSAKPLQLDPKKVEARNNLAITLLSKKGRTDEAIATWQARVANRPAECRLHANLAVAYLNQNRLAETVSQWREALRLQPDKARDPAQSRLDLIDRAGVPTCATEVKRGNWHSSASVTAADQNLITYRVLAAAEAETGDFSGALKTARDGMRTSPGPRPRDNRPVTSQSTSRSTTRSIPSAIRTTAAAGPPGLDGGNVFSICYSHENF